MAKRKTIGRVGITTDPARRMREWQREYPNLQNWRIISTHYSKAEAQKEEERIARDRGYESHPGGSGPEYATWCVYAFEHGGR